LKHISRILAFFSIAVVSVCCAAAEENAAQLVARYDNLSLGGPPVSVSALVITSGSMKLTLGSGSAASVKAGDQVIGMFFKGTGSFEYSAKDNVELPIMKANLRETKSAGTVNNGVLSGSFTEALIAAQNVTLPALEGPAGSALDDTFAHHRAILKNDQESLLSLSFAAHQLTAPAQRIVRAELRGAGDDEWVYEADQNNEKLLALYTYQFDDRARRVERYEAVISERPIGRTRADIAPYDYVLSAVDYTLEAGDGNDLHVVATETITPRVNGIRGLVFGLTDLQYASGEKTPRHYTPKSITTDDGKPLAFAHRIDTLLVSLPQPSMAAAPIKLKFDLRGDLLIRENGDNQWFLRSEWFPEPHTAGMATTAHGVIRVKAPFVPFAGGKTIRRVTEGGYNVLETSIDQPVHFVAVTAGKYAYEEEKRGNMTVRTASYGQKNVRAIKKINALAFDMIQYYEYFLGPFPMDELNIVELNSFGSGQAPAGLVFITSEAFQPLLEPINQLFSEGINERMAHEIAHQYWGVAVRWPSPEEQWLSESFAEYSAALLLKKFQGGAPYNRLLAHWKADSNESHTVAPIPLANRITDEFNRTKLLYGKGPYLLAALHKQVGDEQFLTFMKSYQKSFHNKAGTTKDVAGLLGFVAKQDFKPFFEQYYWGTDVPELK